MKYRVYFSRSQVKHYYVDIEAENSDDAMRTVDSGRHIIFPCYPDTNSESYVEVEALEFEPLEEN